MPYCCKCGTKLNDGDKFCPVCRAATAKMTREEFTVSSDDLMEKVRQLLHEGNVTRIIVKDEKGKTMLEIPVTSRCTCFNFTFVIGWFCGSGF